MKYFTKIVDSMIKFMIPIAIIALMMGIARVILDLRAVFGSRTIAAAFDMMVTNILSMFIVIELLRSIIEYLYRSPAQITFITMRPLSSCSARSCSASTSTISRQE